MRRMLSGLSDDYAKEIQDFKDKLSKIRSDAAQKYANEHPGPVYTPPREYQPPEPPPPEPPMVPTRSNPSSDYGATGAPPISVHGGDEVPPPIPTAPTTPGGHAPIVTGIPPESGTLPFIEYPPKGKLCPPNYHLNANDDCVENEPVATPGGTSPNFTSGPEGFPSSTGFYGGGGGFMNVATGGFGGGPVSAGGLMGVKLRLSPQSRTFMGRPMIQKPVPIVRR